MPFVPSPLESRENVTGGKADLPDRLAPCLALFRISIRKSIVIGSRKQPLNPAIELVKAPTAETKQLLAELDEALSGPYSADQRHAFSVERLFQPDVRFFQARVDGVAVACGGIAFLDGYGELKRMYSRPAVRGRGVAKALLHRLEAEAREAGLSLLRIETGVYQKESLRFYEGAGYRRCAPFGPYAEMPPRAIETSLFYEKRL